MRRTAVMMILVGALLFALTAGVAVAAPGKGKGKGQEKITVCHKAKKSITVGKPAEKAHLKHGDTAGACAAATVPETTMEQTTTAP